MPRKRRVDLCLAALRFYPSYAGPAIRFKRYAPGLRERGVDLRVLSGAWPDDGNGGHGREGVLNFLAGAHPTLRDPIEVDGISVRRVELPAGNRKLMQMTYARALSRYCRSEGCPDVVQLFALVPWASPWLWQLKRRGIPIVYVHTMMENQSLPPHKRRFDQIPYRFVDRVVVSSTVMRDDLRELGVEAAMEVIPNGVDLDRFEPVEAEDQRRALRRRLGLEEHGQIIVFVGGFLGPRKGIDVLADAWGPVARRRPDARLVLVGPELNDLRPAGPQQEFLRRVRNSLEDSGAMDRMTFTGRVENVEEYFQVADLFVFPSRREGMPNVVPEAFACATASILTPFDGLPEEFGRPGEEYVLAERSAEVLAANVFDLLEDPERRRTLGQAARRWVEHHLDVESSLDRYADLYHELMRNRGDENG